MKTKNSGPCLIFAHRGANREAADNTRAAFNKALKYPIDGMETDVQLSLDGIPVLWHDRFLKKLGYPWKHIDDFDYAQLEQMNFAGYFSSPAEPEGVLSLKEFLDAYRGRCQLQIEIKNRDWEEQHRHESKIKQCIDLIGDARENDIFISSFNLASMIFANQYAPGFPLYYALKEHHTLADIKQFLKEHKFLRGLCMPIAILNDAVIQVLRDKGKGIVTYTCNSDEEITKALKLGVDVLITDFPQKALQLRS
ncbi:MAG: glycerophosphodiester phosphodiesterase [Methylobacter sp.]|nr:glycerophosphodiester phosphodiesterase [Methylobacter sp.]